MRPFLPGLILAAFAPCLAPPPASGQADTAPPVAAPPDTAPDVAEAPPPDRFVVIPLRAHVLSATDLPAIECHLTDADVERIVGKVNVIWHKAGIHWAIGPVVREPAARQDRFRAAQEAGDALGLYRLLAPDESKADEGVDVYFIHAFPANGVFLGNRTAFIQETARLRPVPGGIDEPLPRVTAHELGHALGLPHRQDRTNLLASGTSGTILNRAEVDRARERAERFPGAATVPDLRRRLGGAKARGDDIEAARLDAILGAISR